MYVYMRYDVLEYESYIYTLLEMNTVCPPPLYTDVDAPLILKLPYSVMLVLLLFHFLNSS